MFISNCLESAVVFEEKILLGVADRDDCVIMANIEGYWTF